MRLCLRLLAFSFLFPTAFAETTGQVTPWKIQGVDNLISVGGFATNIPRKYKQIVDGIGRITPSICTGTHIGSNVVITAGHCFSAPTEGIENAPCDGAKIEWGVREQHDAFMVSNCTRILAMQTNEQLGVDYAVFLVDRAPRTSLQLDLSRPQYGMPLTMFSHPLGNPLMWSQNCRVTSPSYSQFSPRFIHHRCDTQPGSSGAAVLNASSMKIIGIHNGGDNRDNYATWIWSIPLQQILLKNRIWIPQNK